MGLKICFATSEVAPFAKTGGLADISAALPLELHRAGHEPRVFMPFYSRVTEGGHETQPVEGLQNVPTYLGPRSFAFSLRTATLPGSDLAIYLVDCPRLFQRPGIYTQDADEHLRFLLLTRAAIESCQRMQWSPDVFHCNDWQTALAPLYLKSVYAWDRLFANTKSILTIHNLGYQGAFASKILPDLGLGDNAHLLHQEDLKAGRIGFLRSGILYADALTTVSPTYAKEIQTEALGMGLDPMLRARADSLFGILNGIDEREWNPRTDALIPYKYSVRSMHRKERNKESLLFKLGLPYEKGVPVAGIVTRLTAQKGIELVTGALQDLIAKRDMRFVALGSGEPSHEESLTRLQRQFPSKVCFYRGYSNELAHLIEAGADMFLMPSRYEPCGLNQMYSMKYGTVPVVRKTGGLADTVEQFDPKTGEGTGLVFDHYDVDGLRWAVKRALELYADRKAWLQLLRNGMERDYSWPTQSAKYVELYQRLASRQEARV